MHSSNSPNIYCCVLLLSYFMPLLPHNTIGNNISLVLNFSPSQQWSTLACQLASQARPFALLFYYLHVTKYVSNMSSLFSLLPSAKI